MRKKKRLKDEDTAKRDSWRTPQALWDQLNKQYSFDVDCCASEENKKCDLFHDDFCAQSGEYHSLHMRWMNPPFSKALKMFVELVGFDNWVAIYRSDNFETGIWQDVIFPNCDWVFMFNYRVKYTGFEGDGSRFPSALIGRGVPPPNGLKGICFFPAGLQDSLMLPIGNRA